MRDSALALLACPACRGDLVLAIAPGPRRDPDGHVMTGELACAGCAARYPIARGVPCLVCARTMEDSVETAARFGAEWRIFDHMSSYQERWLAAWLAPVSANDFRGKTVFVHSIVFDQLVTSIAYDLPESEVRSWFDAAGLSDVTIAWHNRNSWRGSGTVTA